MSWLTKYLKIGSETNDLFAEGVEEVKTVTEFLGDVAEKLPDLAEKAADVSDRLPDLFSNAIEASAPWLNAAADALGEALPPIKAILSFAKFLTHETDPYALGLLACSLAYQSALADSARQIAADQALRSRIGRPAKLRLTRESLGDHETPAAFEGFRLDTALSHPLILKADKALYAVANAVGYPQDIQRQLIEGVHIRFAEKFRGIISDGKVKEKFDPLFRLMNLGGKETSTHAIIRRHIDYQLWRFAEAPALGKVGDANDLCPLQQIFEPLDCGVLTWGEIRHENAGSPARAERHSPFDENFGGRTGLAQKVIERLGDPTLTDAIIIQGTAGAGKSAFTLQLCTLLRKESLRPLRIRMRDLSLDPGTPLMADIAQALAQNSGDEVFDQTAGPRPSANDMDLSNITTESVPFGAISICPFVFIFDGWDEISISASEGFRIRIEQTLHAIRRELLSARHSHRVRVILTGRPSVDVNEAKFLQENTPILTVRPFRPSQLEHFVDTLVAHRQSTMHRQPMPDGTLARIADLKKQFDNDAARSERREQNILGLPLLALLAVWLLLNDPNPPENIATERTSLYRRLVDLTTRHGGNVDQLAPTAPRLTGPELRDLLQRTAAAMTLRGTEHISHYELILRLEASGLSDGEMVIGRAFGENDLAKLMLSFFFNTGNREHGCEFIHKSFREYLFAEAIIEALKRTADRPEPPPRTPYWKEPDEGTPLRIMAEELGLLLGPQWISPEVATHLEWLIAWEVTRAVEGNKQQTADNETPPRSIADWENIRDRLVALWDWWAEGVHLRPQPSRPRGKSSIAFDPGYAVRLAEQIAPPGEPRGPLPEPVRTTTIDAHLGDALFRLNCTLHFEINKATGWLVGISEAAPGSQWEGAGLPSKAGRRYQTEITRDGKTWWAFAPSSPDGFIQYMINFIARINAAGWYPGVAFPSGVNWSGVDLRNAPLEGVFFAGTELEYSRLMNASFLGSTVVGCSFTQAFGKGSGWRFCNIIACTMDRAEWDKADFHETVFRELPVGTSPMSARLLVGATLHYDDGTTVRVERDAGTTETKPVLD